MSVSRPTLSVTRVRTVRSSSLTLALCLCTWLVLWPSRATPKSLAFGMCVLVMCSWYGIANHSPRDIHTSRIVQRRPMIARLGQRTLACKTKPKLSSHVNTRALDNYDNVTAPWLSQAQGLTNSEWRQTCGRLTPSAQEYPILGLNILRLLIQNRIAEFYTELELLSSSALDHPCIQHAVELEQSFMEGAYHRVLSARQLVPDANYTYFMDLLAKTVSSTKGSSCCLMNQVVLLRGILAFHSNCYNQWMLLPTELDGTVIPEHIIQFR
ncbi:hypothetical protein RND71_026754 [Anisodus tanguticus]|uniref:CSN8/PSMD8/EIF3K domain-containing protein n=1 Tax=Anisodus tanguticus TaxID=243964 RepID=A0AAE1RLI5_9SOLA|nr:hypothetical protein RND71_026754 [Anisodus tanguticus]